MNYVFDAPSLIYLGRVKLLHKLAILKLAETYSHGKLVLKNKKFGLVGKGKSIKNTNLKKTIKHGSKIKVRLANKTRKPIKKIKQNTTKKIRKIIKKLLSKKTTKRVIKKKHALSLDKPSENPIISPNPENEWEAWQTFNPGVILLDNKVHFLYRAIGPDGISRLGYASSKDGFHVDERSPEPVYEHTPKKRQFYIYSYFSGGSWGGCEDPRLVRVDNEDVIYMTYTACDEGLRVALNSIKVKDFKNKAWNWKTPKIISPPGEIHKNWVIFPEKIKGKYAILHSINPYITIEYVDDLNSIEYIKSYYDGTPPKNLKNCWEEWIRGVGPPPIKSEYGWLVLYHGMDKEWGKYKVGAMLLDLNNPTKILSRSPEPILEPREIYEFNGFKPGIVYASGAVVKDGTLLVYYGGADNYVCVAYTNFKKFIEALRVGIRPKLKKRKLKIRKRR